MIALACAGGGSRGILQFAFLQAFNDLGLHYDRLYTSSVGGLNGILFYQGDMEAAKNLWLQIKNSDVYTPNYNPFSIMSPKGALNDSKPLKRLIDRFVNLDKIKANSRPFTVMISNITKMEPLYVDLLSLPDKESVVKYLLASASPPILFPPVIEENGDHLVDSGVLCNFGITRAINDGADTVICMTPTNYKGKPIVSIIDTIQSTVSTSSFGYLDREVKGVEKVNQVIELANVELVNDLRKINLIVIRPDHAWDQGLIDFNYKIGRQKLMDYGYQTAMKALKPLIK